MKTITFYSYKGGVGRSLALSNIAKRLSEFGKKICIVDFDLEAPGLHLKFNNANVEKVKTGIVDYIYEFTNSGIVPNDINDYITHIKFNNKFNIQLIAAGNSHSRRYWQKLSSINWNDLFYKKNSVGVDFFYNLKLQIESQLNPDFLLIDSRTGITEISGITMSIFADEVVLLAANNEENLQGIAQVLKTLMVPENSIQNKRPKINFVLCRIPYFENQKDRPKETIAKNAALKYLNNCLESDSSISYKLEKVFVIHSDPELELQEKLKIGHRKDSFVDSSTIPIGLDYLDIFEEITKDVISEEEKEKFEDFIRAEILIEKAVANTDTLERIKILKNAMKLNPESAIAFLHLAFAYFDLRQFEKSLETIEDGRRISSNYNSEFLYLRTLILLRRREFVNAYTEAVAFYESNPNGYLENSMLAAALQGLNRHEEALLYRMKLLELYPDSEVVWNDYANALNNMGRYDEALNAIYKALEFDAQNHISIITLAEINAALGNYKEFYKNLELSFSLGTTSDEFQQIIETEDVYIQFLNEERFISILEKYKIDVDLNRVRFK